RASRLVGWQTPLRHRLPQLEAVRYVIGDEEEGSADVGEVPRIRSPVTGVDVVNESSPRIGPVRAPQLATVGAVIGAEVEHPVDVREPGRTGATGAEEARLCPVDVADQGGLGGGAARAPKLDAVGVVPVAGAEEERPGDVGELMGI